MTPGVFDIRGRTALVTGSSRGLGRALADGLLQAGCSVALHGRDTDALERAAAELAATAERTGASVHHAAFDVTDAAAVEAGVAALQAELGPLDILVNNAGVQHRAPLLDFPDDAWRRVIDTNLTSAFLVGRAVARGMVERGRGKIVNVCSLMAELGRAGVAPYAASKGGLKMLTRGMCADWGPSGIQVNAIGPGYFATELTAALVEDPEFDAWLRRRTPAGRWGTPGDLIGALLFLASPASDFVNGQVLYVDGGISAVV
jgi:gluconate 5-dehydrogenase